MQVVRGRLEAAGDVTADIPERVALHELFDRQFDTVFRFVLARSGDREIADEVAAETFMAAAQALESGAEKSIGLPWLFVVARRRLIDTWRRRERERDRLNRLLELDQRGQAGTIEDCYPSETAASRALHALRSLPERQREAVALRYLDGYSVSEVAHVMEVSYGAAESLLTRGRNSFRNAWEAL